MKKYQAIFILSLKTVTDEGQSLVKEIQQKLKKRFFQLKIYQLKLIGKKTLARSINKINNGLFVRVVFSTKSENILPFKESYRLNRDILRLVVYVYDIPEELKVLQL